jgi:hypothetical protein
MGRIKTEGYSHDKADARRDRKRQEAEARQAAHDPLTIEEKFAKTNTRRGASARESERISGEQVVPSDLRALYNLKSYRVSPSKK